MSFSSKTFVPVDGPIGPNKTEIKPPTLRGILGSRFFCGWEEFVIVSRELPAPLSFEEGEEKPSSSYNLIFEWNSGQQHGIGINDFFKAIAPIEEKIRDRYSETIECSRQEFLEMMVLDGCFIIELFCIVGGIVQGDIDDPIFKMTRMIFFIMRDLLKLENQIPFFVLETLFETSILSSRKQNVSSLTVLALKFFDHAVQRPPEVLRREENESQMLKEENE
ncbi:hypothetical protein NC652_011832 [Populus alba x Populus x berolinensis]|nr:hypothetical protein NC652_011832 [Populus alba x Populus x berolinensis]